MVKKLLMIVVVMVPLLMVGCQTDPAAVSVRFVLPAQTERFADASDADETSVVGFEPSDAEKDENPDPDEESLNQPDPALVILWGERFRGDDVTHRNSLLEPGDYTFTYWENAETTALQGWIRVNDTAGELIDVMRRWSSSIPDYKRMLAYDFEIQDRLRGADPSEFENFDKQLRSMDQLQRQIESAIKRESRMLDASRQHGNLISNDATVLLFPDKAELLASTTDPAFSEDDLGRARSGEVVTKMLFLSDHKYLQWKLRMVDHLNRDLLGCKAVFREEIERLERRKRLFQITDHNHDHDTKFVVNETRLQKVLAAMARIEEQVADLRLQRIGLAFADELTAPDSSFSPLDDERRGLEDQRNDLETRKQRFDLLFEATKQDSLMHVALQRQRQRCKREIEQIDSQFEMLAEARDELERLKQSSVTIQRRGEFQLLSTAMVERDIPTPLREAIERMALMTVRLRPCDGLPTPSAEKFANAR